MRWRPFLRAARLGLGGAWAGGLILSGLALWPLHAPLALCPLAAGEYVLMRLVLDDLCPRANPEVTGFFKLVAALVFVLALAGCITLWWTRVAW